MEKRKADTVRRIESESEISAYLDRLTYALQSKRCRINFQIDRQSDGSRDIKYTNRHTLLTLFPDEDSVEVLKRELNQLAVEEYIKTVKDNTYKMRSEMRVFGKKYSGEDVYIKIRVELLNAIAAGGDNYIYVMSFHFAEENFVESNFPYRKNRGE